MCIFLLINRVLLISLAHVVTHGRPVQSHVTVEELGNIFRSLPQQTFLVKKLDTLLGLRRKTVQCLWGDGRERGEGGMEKDLTDSSREGERERFDLQLDSMLHGLLQLFLALKLFRIIHG